MKVREKYMKKCFIYFIKVIILVIFIILVMGTLLPLFVIIIRFILPQLPYKMIYSALYALPFALVAFAFAIIKTSFSKDCSMKYRIGFWPAVKYAPEWMSKGIYILILIILINIFFDGESIVFFIITFFNYLGCVITLSTLLEIGKITR